MTIFIRLFAILRDRAGVSALIVTLPEPSAAAAARAAVLEQHPELADLLPQVAVAVNQSYAADDTALHDGDEVAFIPPVSGG